MLFSIPFSAHRATRYHINTDEMVTGIWKLMVRLKMTGIRHAWVLVSRD